MILLNQLPFEVIEKIYTYLNADDKKSAQLTCHQLLKASTFQQNEHKIFLKLITLNSPVLELFQNSFRHFECVHLQNSYFEENLCINQEDLLKFFSIVNISQNIKYLILEDFKDLITVEAFCQQILKLLPKLTKLICKNTYFTKFEQSVNESNYNNKIIEYSEILSSIISSYLNSIEICNDLVLFSKIKNLKELKISLGGRYNENLNFTFDQIIQNNENTLENLSIYIPQWKARLPLYNKNNLKLKKLSLNSCFNWPEIVNFCKNQRNLVELELTEYSDIMDKDAISILQNQPLLEKLKLEGAYHLTSETIKEIAKLKNLKKLNINKTVFDGYRLIDILLKDINYKIIELKCNPTPFTDKIYVEISKKLPNLQVLHSSSGNNKLTDVGLQSIIKNCENLTDLYISSYEVTDNGLLGIDSQTKEKCGNMISNLKKLQYLTLIGCNLTLEMLNALKFDKLKVLNIESLKSIRYHPAIEYTDLEIIKIFAQNCPKIQELSILNGLFLNGQLYDILEIFMENLKNLKKLNITGWYIHWSKEEEFTHENESIIDFEILHQTNNYTFKVECNCKQCCDIKETCQSLCRNHLNRIFLN